MAMGIISNFLTSGHTFSEEEYELKTKFVLLNLMLSLTAISVILLTVVQWEKSNLIAINGMYIVVIFFSIYLLRIRKKNYFIVGSFTFLSSIVILTLAIVHYPTEYMRTVWFLILIAFSFFFDGVRGGLIIFFLSVVDIVMIFFFSDVQLNIHTLLLMIAFMVLISLIISMYEKREEIIKQKLYDMNLYLEERVQEKTREIVEQKDAYQELAHYDLLTNLPNRLLFNERLKFSINRAKRNNTKLSILFLDVDHFKSINDLFGHSIGDEVLVTIARRLQKHLRSSDTLARIGGDEFTLILEDLNNLSNAGAVAQNLRHAIAKPIWLNGHELFVTISIGISVYPKDSTDPSELLKCADTALYSAKKDGRNLSHYYKEEMTQELLAYLTLETAIRHGIENDEFVVYYQPFVDAVSEQWIGVEALVRWHHPQKGLLGPDEFIPVAEASSLIISIGEKVMTQVAEDMKRWHEMGFNPGTVSVNLSVKQLSDRNLLPLIQNILKRVTFREDWLELEITESYAFQKPNEAVDLLKQIRALGVRLSIDDFGTGYSSLSYLKRLPVNKLKIDREFIKDIPGNKDDETLVRTIVAMAQNLSLDIVAEGIETENQKMFLMQLGCNTIQGYLYAKPMSAKAIEKSVKTMPNNAGEKNG
jgi:diguanylate cyclase (GGDEF)-like protein